MTKDAVPKPTEAELEVLQILWKHGPGTGGLSMTG